MRKLAVLFVLISCGGDEPTTDTTKVCAPGQQIECACQAGAKGAQACKADGSGYGLCDCGMGSGGSAGSAASDASSKAGAGGAAGSGAAGANSVDAEADGFIDIRDADSAGSAGAAGATGVDAEADGFADITEADSAGPCASGVRWNNTMPPSEQMNPGVPCWGAAGCHTPSSKTVLTAAGTIYPVKGQHDENNCNGLDYNVAGAIAVVAFFDPDTGAEIGVRAIANSAGNFWRSTQLPATYKVKVYHGGRESVMIAPVTDGNCNYCHSADGIMGAHGRIVPMIVDAGPPDLPRDAFADADASVPDIQVSDIGIDVGADGPVVVECTGDVAALISQNHATPHSLSIPLADITAGVDKTYNAHGAATHDHWVALYAADFTTLKAGGTVFKKSCNSTDHEYVLSCGVPSRQPTAPNCTDECGLMVSTVCP